MNINPIRIRSIIGWFVTSLILTNCNLSNEEKENSMSTPDPHSFSQPQQSVITHLDWKANIDFDKKTINGEAKYRIKSSKSASYIILDTKNLSIESVTNGNNESLEFQIGEKVESLGSPLKIAITPQTRELNIKYQTSPNAEALQWLKPSQTAGKENPFLFTQSQAILARSWIPVQDSPGIRFTYGADVKVPSHLLALMSADNPTKLRSDGNYHFEMKQPIPAYLMALAVGDIKFQSLGKRSGVYAEPSMLQKSANEFEDLENMISAAENLYGPYQWDRYDLIVLPPSFPFGGMENPRLTFATPTILAGDKSLTSLVAHELAHSWSGNLVTNATWDDFWLNEGFTVYFEYRIMEAMYGRPYSEMLSLLSYQDLNDEVKEMIDNGEAEDTKLKLNLIRRNPDDGMTAIAYEKGYFFLRLLDEKVGRQKFDDFLKTYFSQNAFKVMTTEEFVIALKRDLFDAYKIDWDQSIIDNWVYGVGLPQNCPLPVSDKFTIVDEAREQWMIDEDPESLDEKYLTYQWSTHEWLHFLRTLPDSLNQEQMSALDNGFGFTQSNNSEITAAWLMHVVKNEYTPGYNKLETFLVNTGRRKFLTPLYKALILTANGKQMATDIYKKARPNYHFVSYSTMDELLKN